MRKVLFAKYNRTRKEEFQLKTCIYEDDNGYHVEKCALNSHAIDHICRFEEYYKALNGKFGASTLVKPHILDNKVIFDYIDGISIDDYLKDYVSNIDVLINEIQKKIDQIFVFSKDDLIDFYITDQFVQVFGNVEIKSCKALKIANIDSNFDNIIIKDNGLFCLDYEWVFDFPVPIEYIIYRALLYFYNKYHVYFTNNITQESFISRFGYLIETQKIYWSMEDNFQQYVQGINRSYIYTNNYVKKTIPLNDLINIQHELQCKIQFLNEMIKQVELKENHIKNLENIINAKESSLKISKQREEEFLNEMTKQIELKENHIKNLEDIINVKESSIKQSVHAIEQLELQNKFNSQEKEHSILDLNNQLAELKNQLAVKSNTINLIDTKIKELLKADYISLLEENLDQRINQLCNQFLQNESQKNLYIDLTKEQEKYIHELEHRIYTIKKALKNPLWGAKLLTKKTLNKLNIKIKNNKE